MHEKKTILCNQTVCSSVMHLLRELTKAGTNSESVKTFENQSSQGDAKEPQAQMRTNTSISQNS